MHVAFVSHKVCWAVPGTPGTVATVGGFPFHVLGVAGAFRKTTLVVPVRKGPLPAGASRIEAPNLTVAPLDDIGLGRLPRKAALPGWLATNGHRLWHAIAEADAVHAPVPGDIGTLGVLTALVQRKPLFVRHCGTWGEPASVADRALDRLLTRIAGGRNVVMATGGGNKPPSRDNPEVSWIFSTTITEASLAAWPTAKPWTFGEELRLVSVGRLTPKKNADVSIRAVALLREYFPAISLDVLGGGTELEPLRALVHELNLENAVRVQGNVPHERVLEIVGRSHLFVFPTEVKEGFPKAVIEAMACGVPVVATGVSVLPDLIGTENGRILAGTAPDDMAHAVLDLTADPDRLEEMSRSARETGRSYTLERWRETIAVRLQESWSRA